MKKGILNYSEMAHPDWQSHRTVSKQMIVSEAGPLRFKCGLLLRCVGLELFFRSKKTASSEFQKHCDALRKQRKCANLIGSLSAAK